MKKKKPQRMESPRMPNTKLRQLVVDLRERTNPPTSFAKIAAYLGCSRQNAYKLYRKGKSEGLSHTQQEARTHATTTEIQT